MMYDPLDLANQPAKHHGAAHDMGEVERETLAANVRKARAAVDWTQAELGARAGLSQRQISLIESGKLNITFDKLYALAAALDTQIHELVKR
jgi:DNA-binding XRE family transcriptional regulator